MLLHVLNQRYKQLKIKNGKNDRSGNAGVNSSEMAVCGLMKTVMARKRFLPTIFPVCVFSASTIPRKLWECCNRKRRHFFPDQHEG